MSNRTTSNCMNGVRIVENMSDGTTLIGFKDGFVFDASALKALLEDLAPPSKVAVLPSDLVIEAKTLRVVTASGEETGFRLEIVDGKARFAVFADQFFVDGVPLYDPRKDSNFSSSVEQAVRDDQKRRHL